MVYVANSSIEWFKEQNIALMLWPPYSPTLNSMDDIRGLLSRMVYTNGGTF